jgi:hypothetical protein
MNTGFKFGTRRKQVQKRVEGTGSYIFKELFTIQLSFEDSRGGCQEDTFVL